MKTGREYSSQYCSCFQITCPQVAKNLPSVKHEMKCQDAIFDWHRQQEADLYPLAKLHADSERLPVITQMLPHCIDKESTFPVDCGKSAFLWAPLSEIRHLIFKLAVNVTVISKCDSAKKSEKNHKWKSGKHLLFIIFHFIYVSSTWKLTVFI